MDRIDEVVVGLKEKPQKGCAAQHSHDCILLQERAIFGFFPSLFFR
jgi:hypothetical protein